MCWRLARQLVREHGIAVRLWVDELLSTRRLIPSLNLELAVQRVDGVEIVHWTDAPRASYPGEVVIAAFACALPDAFVEAMAVRMPRPVWINLEYLSAEDWVAGCHGLPSPHPRLPLTQHFFFPGLDGGTGGLLREADYAARREAFSRERFLTAIGLPPAASGELLISLFSYENKGLAEIVDCWQSHPGPLTCLVPEGRVLPPLASALGIDSLRPGDVVVRGALTLCVLPFVEQARYDELLWSCDLNFVRGEDSFVRAQWAEKPFVWHIYAQQEDAHLEKLEAFLARYRAGLDPEVARALTDFWLAWNRGEGIGEAWPAFLAALPALFSHAKRWSAKLQEVDDLASQLVQFCKVALE